MLLAKTNPVQADVVVAVPDSGVSAASGYAHEAKIPMEFGLLKNRYIGRTFIEPEKIRKSSVELKFNAVVEIVAGKDIILVDDSLVRGNTLKHVVRVLREYGTKKIHVRIASPPVKYPDYYGIDTPSGNDLLSSKLSKSEITEALGVDSLAHISLNDWIKSTGLQGSQLCLSCFNGQYPIPVPHEH
jgi:amidophosphoribosyltransferase